MILKSLVDYYENLKEKGLIAVPGWAEVGISYALQLSPKGELVQCVCMMGEVRRGGQTVRTPAKMNMPAPVKRTGPGFRPNFLYDNAAYTMGIDTKGAPARAEACFREAGKYYRGLLRGLNCPEAAALVKYYDTWDPRMAGEHPALQAHIKDMLKGGNITFMVGDRLLHEVPALRGIWDDTYRRQTDAVLGTDLITNQTEPISVIHPSIRGVAGAQATGAVLVSFNEPSACSYSKAQGYNAPVGRQNAFAYTAALNYLASDRDRQYCIGSVSLFHWAGNADAGYQDFINAFFFGKNLGYAKEELTEMAGKIIAGEAVEAFDTTLSHDMPYTFLGLAPNMSRLSVRLFQQDTFSNFLCSILAWWANMYLLDSDGRNTPIPVYQYLMAGRDGSGKDSCISPAVIGEGLRAILTGAPVPAALYSDVQRRITTEHNITRAQAAVIKAYHLTAPGSAVSRAALSASLNPACTELPYILGRLFATLEEIQSRANPNQVSIRTGYFRATSANPAVVFPLLLRNSEHHMRGLGKSRRYFRRRLDGLLAHLAHGYPKNLSPSGQREFLLGYYHQRCAGYAAVSAHMEVKKAHV